MIHILYRYRTGISRQRGCAAQLISLLALVGGLELLTRFFI